MKSILLESKEDLFDWLKGMIATGITKSGKKDNSYLNGSISNYTKNLVMTFPTLCDNSLPPSTASMISRANEKNIVTMLQMLFASMNLSGENGANVLSQIHKNINSNQSMDDYIDAVDNFVDKYYNESSISDKEILSAVKEMVDQLKVGQKSFPINSLNERSLNEYAVYNIHGNEVVREVQYSDDELKNMTDDELNRAQKQVNIARTQQQMQDADLDIRFNTGANKNAELQAKYSADQAVALTKQLFDQDIKKANELQPTLLIVKYFITDDEDKKNVITNQQSFIAGVKSRLIAVDSVDIMERMISKNKTKVNFLNLIRATTGEIKFWKDFVFCIDQAKIDAKNSSKKGEAAKMWKVLENRSSKNFIKKNGKSGNDASAITSLVINQETVNMLKKQYGFDIEQVKNARMIMDAYNLLALFIADESIEVCKSLYAGNDQFEQQAYSFLERESNDNSYKKVINLIGKMNGR